MHPIMYGDLSVTVSPYSIVSLTINSENTYDNKSLTYTYDNVEIRPLISALKRLTETFTVG